MDYYIDSESLSDYVDACFNIASIFFWNNPSMIITPLRGAKPYVDLTKYILDFHDVNYESFELPTSGFIMNREFIIYEGLKEAFNNQLSNDLPLSFLFPDSFISGSALKNFKYNFNYHFLKGIISDLELSDEFIYFIFVALKQGYHESFEPVYEKSDKLANNNLKIIKYYSLGLKDIITEDEPSLLGIDYHDSCLPFKDCEDGLKVPVIKRVLTNGRLLIDGECFDDSLTIHEQFMLACRELIDKKYFSD